ncbi:hypothetical protein [Kibdelosporangium philippinense]
MSTVPEHRVHRSGTLKCTFQHGELHAARGTGNFTVQDWSTHCAGTVDTV